MSDIAEKERTYSTREFSNIFGFYTQSVQEACKSGEIKATKNEIGRWQIPESEITRFKKEYPTRK